MHAGLLAGGASGQTLSDDVAALLAFKANSADSALASWVADGSTSPCDAASYNDFETGWARVQCDAPGGRVSHVSLGCDASSTLAGDVTELASLSSLTYLNVQDCELVTGDIAAFASTECQSAHLTALYLQRTAVSGDIAGLGQCTGLQQLSLVGTTVYGDPAGLRAFLGSTWADFDACASLSGCPSGTINPIPSYIGPDLATCCAVQCDLFPCTAATHLKPAAASLALYSQAECCDADSCSGNAAAVDDWACTAGSLINGASTTIGASDATCCLLTCANNTVGPDVTCATSLKPAASTIVGNTVADCCTAPPPPPPAASSARMQAWMGQAAAAGAAALVGAFMF